MKKTKYAPLLLLLLFLGCEKERLKVDHTPVQEMLAVDPLLRQQVDFLNGEINCRLDSLEARAATPSVKPVPLSASEPATTR